jgi:hypothetical protein
VTHSATPPLTAEQAEAVQILAKSWAGPESRRRNKAYLALCSGLLQSGLPQEQVEAVVEALVEATGDEEAPKRVAAVAATAARLENCEPVTGWPTLDGLLGDCDGEVVLEFRRRMGLVVTVEALARHKQFPADFLQAEGLHDLPDGRGLGIPYTDLSGKTVAVKERTSLVAGRGSYWPKGRGCWLTANTA